jgi:hypothetical protein
MFSGYGLLALDDLPKGLKINVQYFCNVVLEEARQAVMTIIKKSGIEEVLIHMDNWKVHNYAKTTKRLEEFQATRLPRPAYSPDVSLHDFWFFNWSKDVWQGQKLHDPDHV